MLIPKTKEKILKVFFYNPRIPLYVREVSRKARISTQNAHHYLRNLEEVGFLSRYKENNRIYFKARTSNPFLIKFFEIFELERKLSISSKKKKLYSRIRQVENTKTKQALIGLVLSKQKLLITRSSSSDSNTLTLQQFKQKLSDPNYYNDLMKQRVVVFGESVFWELVR